MKKFYKPFLMFTLFVLITACGGDDGPGTPPPTEAELRTGILTAGTGKWNIPTAGAVIIGEGANTIDATDLFENFSVTFTKTGYTTTGNTPVWARSGTWSFTNNTGTVFKREDNVEVTIIEISDTAMKLSLQWNQTTYEDGRSNSLAGKHVFTFLK